MNVLRHLIVAWGDRDQATPAESVVVMTLLLLLLLAAGMSDGPA